MVKRTLALVVSAIATSTAFVGCTDYTEFTTDELKHLAFLKNYDKGFVDEFGHVDPNHDWGMNEEIGALENITSLSTRAGEVVVNRNQWTEFDNNSKRDSILPTYNGNGATIKVPNYRSTALANKVQIPGWPHLNGLYYAANGNLLDSNYYTGDAVTSGMIPAGDITPYEIQYVSAWFRTHKNPKSNVKLHLSDFFIQNVSCDYDQVAYADLDEPYATGWAMTGKNGRNMATVQDALNHTAWNGGNYADNLVEPISYDLDYLGFLDLEGNWTHVNNFNRGNSNFSPEDNESNRNREIKYIKSSGTEDFSCHPSWCTNTDTIKSWVLVRLTWNETVKHDNSPYTKGTVIPREGYYLAFDFHGKKQGSHGMQEVHRDGYYSNWIVKITPGHNAPTAKARRIFCEDLGGSLDFDFDDAVIDVAFDEISNNVYQPVITVQAAGGTMPIYVEEKGENYELHKMLGAETDEQVNVDDAKYKNAPPAIYRSKKTYSKTNVGQISITVKNNQGDDIVEYSITGSNADNSDDERAGLDKDSYDDCSDKAPRAFAAPISVKWMKERKNIKEAYEDFRKWVNNKDWKAPGTNSPWYNNPRDEANLLYTPANSPERDNPTSAGGDDKAPKWTVLTPDAGAATIVSKVKADSYMKLNGYDGADPIYVKLDGMDETDRVTFTVVLSSPTLYNQIKENTKELEYISKKLEGIFVPADIVTNAEGTSMANNGKPFTYNDFKRFNTATYVKESVKTFDDDYTYTMQFSFTKSDIAKATGGYHDYLLLFLRTINADGTESTLGTGTQTGKNSDVTVREWYVHY